jgi:serine/threonine protein kinase/class 3 adenylate cyclase
LPNQVALRFPKYIRTTGVLPRCHWLPPSPASLLLGHQFMHSAHDVDALLNARAEIDEQLRRHKNALTVLFTDVVGSTSFFERNGDTAGLVMIHRHDELATRAIRRYDGQVIKTIGDSAMAEFPNPGSAVRAAVEIERQFLKLNLTLPENQRVEVRIGIHTGIGFRKGNDLFGDVVNVTARIVKRTAPAQILISRAMYDEISKDPDLQCQWLSKLTIDGRTEKEDIFEVVWTDVEAYRDMQDRRAASSHIPPRYEVLSQIGTGGTGIVYKVRDLETSEIVALKILKPEIASDPDVQENFKRELCLARKITHKNVCRIHEFSRLNGTAYTSMELVEGESLLSRLYRTGSLPLNEALAIARQICAGLREAHAQGIVHRDLKPANIMLDRNSTVKIMDFGIARMIQRDGPMTGTIVGTPGYMAPEQAELKPVSPCTDIYAVGLLLYEMITGMAAFNGDTPVAIALKQIREYPKRPREIVPELSRQIDAVIMKCLQKDAAKRFQSVDQFEIALGKAAKARPVRPWEVAINRGLERVELEIRDRLWQGAEKVETFLERQDWRALPGIQKEPTAMLGVAGLVGALTVFVLFGGWKPRTINAQTVQVASQNSLSPVTAVHDSVSGPTMLSARNSFGPIASREVDLYEDFRTDNAKTLSSNPELPNENLGSESATPPGASPKPSRIAKRAKSQVRTDGWKAQLDAQNSTQTQVLASPTQPETPTSDGAPKSVTQEPAINSTQPNTVPEPTVEQVNTASQPKTGGVETKAPKLYFEVGTFKDETWANDAVDKLTQLGFHAVLIHKNLLWSQSYHVEVGPYTNQKDIAEARQSLASQGFKAHPVN